MSIEKRFANGYTTSFDYLRVVLAAGALGIHSVAVLRGDAGNGFLFEPPPRSAIVTTLLAIVLLGIVRKHPLNFKVPVARPNKPPIVAGARASVVGDGR